MKIGRESKNRRRVARTLSLLALGFMSIVSLVVFYTEDHLTDFDYVLLLGAPIAFSVLAYFVGFHHDPTASD
jgi:uncharacterized membrane protein YfcA